MSTILQPPALAIDARLYPGGGPPPLGRIERRIVWNLLAHLRAAGFAPYTVAGGDEGQTPTLTPEAVMEEVFDLDVACVGFVRVGAGPEEVGNVVLVRGNDGDDIISDWRWTAGDPAGFDAAMDHFQPEAFV